MEEKATPRIALCAMQLVVAHLHNPVKSEMPNNPSITAGGRGSACHILAWTNILTLLSFVLIQVTLSKLKGGIF